MTFMLVLCQSVRSHDRNCVLGMNKFGNLACEEEEGGEGGEGGMEGGKSPNSQEERKGLTHGEREGGRMCIYS